MMPVRLVADPLCRGPLLRRAALEQGTLRRHAPDYYINIKKLIKNDNSTICLIIVYKNSITFAPAKCHDF